MMVTQSVDDALLRRASATSAPIGYREIGGGGGAVRRLLAACGRMGGPRPLGGVARAVGATDAELARLGGPSRPTPEDVRVHALLRLYGGTPPRR